jgi:hyperosmotically inducible periplasmic protein
MLAHDRSSLKKSIHLDSTGWFSMLTCKSRATVALAAILQFGLSAGLVYAQDAQTKPDNTATNKRDRNKAAPTADDQKNNKNDLETTRKIRRAVMKDKSLSIEAHNVKIITRDGTVTLRGPVHSDEEQKAIVAHAAEVAGQANVKNEIQVASKQ